MVEGRLLKECEVGWSNFVGAWVFRGTNSAKLTRLLRSAREADV
jgi:hypothetical protein